MTTPYITYRDAARILGHVRPDGQPDVLSVEGLVRESKLRTIGLLTTTEPLISRGSLEAYIADLYTERDAQ